MPPDGQVIEFNGKTYIVSPSGEVFVMNWRKLEDNSPTAAAVRHQAKHGHGK